MPVSQNRVWAKDIASAEDGRMEFHMTEKASALMWFQIPCHSQPVESYHVLHRVESKWSVLLSKRLLKSSALAMASGDQWLECWPKH